MLRSSVVLDSGRALARGANTATRYCAIRMQLSDKDRPAEVEELQVLDYPMVQNRLVSFDSDGIRNTYDWNSNDGVLGASNFYAPRGRKLQ